MLLCTIVVFCSDEIAARLNIPSTDEFEDLMLLLFRFLATGWGLMTLGGARQKSRSLSANFNINLFHLKMSK